MVNIVIVEDEKIYQDQIKEILKKLNYLEEDIQISVFNKFNTKLKELINSDIARKIYIMDIELGTKISGIEIAKYIRARDWESEIIFMTNHDKMFETAYRSVYEVFDFIEKFHNLEERLTKDLKAIFKKKIDNKMFKYENKNVSIQIYYHSIIYIYREKESRKLVVVTDKNTYIVPITLTDALTRLDSRFHQVHRACIANTERIETFNWAKGYFITDTGDKVDMLTKTFKDEVRLK